VQSILQGISGLPEDRFVNTWAFASDAADSDSAQLAAIDKVKAFFGDTYGGEVVKSFLSSPAIDETKCEMRAYYMGDPPDFRVPLISPWDIGPMSTSGPLPSECAVCVSYYSELNKPRRRGRVYIGPLGAPAVQSSTTQGPRVSAGFQTVLLAAALELATPDTGPQWAFVAMQDATSDRILRVPTHLWVDNAFDTQRRRGEQASVRLTGVVTP